MILTVSEAKKKDCCSPAFLDDEPTGFCKGDGCMAWRWREPFYSHTEKDLTLSLPVEIINLFPGEESAMKEEEYIQSRKPKGEGWEFNYDDHYWYRHHPEKRRGYCGLAGKPEEE